MTEAAVLIRSVEKSKWWHEIQKH